MTDTLVLKNKLVMPQQGTNLELDQDEMEYVDGGVSAQVICRAIGIAAFGSLCQIVSKVSIFANLGDAAIKIVAKECLSFLGLVGLSTLQFAACVYNISKISR